jgi:hypothetical protein
MTAYFRNWDNLESIFFEAACRVRELIVLDLGSEYEVIFQ